MNKKDLCIRLGVSSWNELEDIITENTKHIFNNRLEFKYDEENEVFILPIPSPKYLEDSCNNVKKTVEQLRAPNGIRLGWKAFLSSKNTHKNTEKHLIVTKGETAESDLIHISPELEEHKIIDHGHLLPSCVSHFIDIQVHAMNNGTNVNFFSRTNLNNIIPEFKYANEQIQHDYECDVSNWLNSNDDIYYEVEAIYYSLDDVMPIAVRILCNDLINRNNVFHIVAPNFDDRIKSIFVEKDWDTYKTYRSMFHNLWIGEDEK